MMTRRSLLVSIGFILLAASSPAQPIALTHSGYLLDAGDAPVGDALVPMQFRIHSSATAQALVWQSDTCQVQVSAGYFATVVGGTCNGTPALDATYLPAGA